MSLQSVVRGIEVQSQQVANILANPAFFNSSVANSLITGLELIKGSVRELTIQPFRKADIIGRIDQAEAIVRAAVAAGFITVEQLNSLLGLLQLVSLKVASFCGC